MTDDAHTLAGAYAMDALSDTERRRFESHLAECPTCAQEVQGLREATSRLAMAAARPAPPGLRDRVFADIQRTRQLSPRSARSQSSGRGRHAAWVLAAACLVLALAGGVAAVRFHGDADRARALNDRVAAIMTAPDARAVTAQAPGSGTVTVVASRSQDRAVIAAARLRRLPSDRTYQLWRLGSGAPLSAGLLRSPGDRPVITTGLDGVQRIGLTVEPKGGSRAPTTAPLLTLPLT
ncbi:anti-sigma factor [Spirillospora sp. CA-294931]|uniref:anti-sigma factor n=1 Tax=Spirillospora sp. CA-294931 TaxID=3240042 RepID=UPI003D93C0BC